MIDTSGARSVVLCVETAGPEPSLAARCLVPDAYRLVTFESRATAARTLRRRVFDAYFLEARDGGTTELRLCRLIRRRDPHAPVLVYSCGAEVTAEDAARAGATQLLDASRMACIEIADMVARCIAAAEVRNVLAVSAEIAAAHEYLAEQHEDLAEVSRAARERAARLRYRALGAQRRYAEAMALQRYLEAGGTRAGFQRAWLSLNLGQPASSYH